MNIRAATAADVSALDAIAIAAKAHWGYGARQLEAWRSELEVDAGSLDTSPVLVAEHEGLAVGFVQVAIDTTPGEIVGMWVLPALMGRGIGRALLARACELAASRGVRELAIDSDPNAVGFYESCGAVVVGDVPAPIEGDPGRARPQLVLRTIRDDR